MLLADNQIDTEIRELRVEEIEEVSGGLFIPPWAVPLLPVIVDNLWPKGSAPAESPEPNQGNKLEVGNDGDGDVNINICIGFCPNQSSPEPAPSGG